MPGFQFQNHSVETILLVGSLLVVLSVLASRISSRFGVPSLLLFLGIGMLAGSEGPGSIEFDNYALSFAIGSVCLGLIMFDGGMRTSWKAVRPILPVGVSLSFLGTVITGVVTGVFAHYTLGLGWLEALLLGSMVSSTDAAAVFSILRARSLTLKGSLKQVLEFEAGSNDPVAIFLTMSFLGLLSIQESDVTTVVSQFFLQAGLGLGFGWLGGKAVRWLINNIGVEYEGLYSVLLLGLVIFLFSLTASLGGSGFLAVYVAGLVLGNSELLHKGSISRFVDGMAWIAQIIVFLTLGLLSFPSHLLAVWQEGLLLALFMMFIARPVSVRLAAPGTLLQARERHFVSWVGLRGAAPIILATLPWSVGLPNAEYYFNLIFFVVILSVIIQGISIPWFAEKVGVTEPLPEDPPTVMSAGFLPAGFISVEIEVGESSSAIGTRIVDLVLPGGVLLTSLQREQRFLVPKGDTVVAAGDRIWGLARPSNVEDLQLLFGKAKVLA